MKSSIVVILNLSAVGIALANTFPFPPGVQPNYDNIPQCLQPKVQGMCLAYFQSYYYNAVNGTCEEFIYGGCQGNKNRFATFDECMKTCSGVTVDDFKLQEETSERNAEAVCSLPKETGLCYASFSRFYFNGKECEEFIFGGCQGNANNFETIEECSKLCKPENPPESAENQA